MNVTETQKAFLDHYYAALEKKDKRATVEEMVEVFVVLYLEAKDDFEKEQAAYYILKIQPRNKRSDLEALVNMDELCRYAAAKQKKVENGAKGAQEKRHWRRGDFCLTDAEWEQAVQYFKNECAYCGVREKITFEHVIPFSKGGAFSKENIIPACPACNSSKNDLDFAIWYRNQPFYDEMREKEIIAYLNQMSSSALSS